MTYLTPERMAEGRRSIAKAKDAVRYAMQDLEAVVQGHFEPGDKVEYQHGLDWVGPCTLIAVYGLNEFGPEITVRNDRTGKIRRRLCASHVRHVNEQWDHVVKHQIDRAIRALGGAQS